MIKMGTKPVQNIEDVLEEYIEYKEKVVGNKIVFEKTLEKGEKMVYSCISFEPIHLDTLCRRISMNIDDVQLQLIKLELKGIFEQLPNKYFIKKV